MLVPGVMTRDESGILVGEPGPNKASLVAAPGETPPTCELEELSVTWGSAGALTHYAALSILREATAAFVVGGTLPADALPQS